MRDLTPVVCCGHKEKGEKRKAFDGQQHQVDLPFARVQLATVACHQAKNANNVANKVSWIPRVGWSLYFHRLLYHRHRIRLLSNNGVYPLSASTPILYTLPNPSITVAHLVPTRGFHPLHGSAPRHTIIVPLF